MRESQIAVQLYTVRDLTAADMLGTLRQLAEIGYEAVEFAGCGDATPEEIRATLDEHGMRAASAHVPLARWDDPGSVFEELHTLGCAHAAVPSVPEDRRGTLAQAQELVKRLNRLGADCKEQGLHLSYHNHAFEFEPLEQTTLWNVLVAETDPALVGLELDVYWAQYAGESPVELIGRIAGRVPLLHLKDMANAPDRAPAPVGAGVLNFDAILPAGARAGTEWYIVEQDTSHAPLEDLRISLASLRERMKGPSIGTMPHSQPL